MRWGGFKEGMEKYRENMEMKRFARLRGLGDRLYHAVLCFIGFQVMQRFSIGRMFPCVASGERQLWGFWRCKKK